MDELDDLGSSLGGLGGFSASASSAATATAGAPISADTDINFGSGSISDSPTIVSTPGGATSSAAAATGQPPAQQPSLAVQQALPQYTTPLQNTTVAGTPAAPTFAIGGSSNTLLYAGIVVAVVAAFIIFE